MAKHFDVFLSHNSRDKPLVRRLDKLLKQRDLEVWLDEGELIPGTSWQVALEEAIEEVRSVAVLVGDSGIGAWQEIEMRAFLIEAASRGLPVIPVLLPRAPIDVRLPLFLRAHTWVDCRDGFTAAMIDRLEWGITGKKPRLETAHDAATSSLARSLRIRSNFVKRRGRIPWKYFRSGGSPHYNIHILVEAKDKVLDSIVEVEYTLHDTFPQPRRVSSDRDSCFSIEIWTYGCFEMSARIYFDDGSMLEASHDLEFTPPADTGRNYVDLS